MSLYKEKLLKNDSIQLEVINKLLNDGNVKTEPIIKDFESSNKYNYAKHESKVNASNKRIAKCVSFDMRKSIAEKFGIVSKHNVALGNIDQGVHKVKGDGNCFFRAAPFIITGNEDDHKPIRDKVINYMCNEIQDEMTGYLNIPIRAHICKTKMLENVTWATDAKIIGCASFMQVDIQVYSKYGAKTKWMIYPCSLRLNQLSDYSIFLDNSTGIHFDVVINN